MSGLRVGFVTASDTFWHHHLVAAKQGVQWLTGAFSPDVYALPRFLGDGCRFVRTGSPLSESGLDLIFSELNGSTDQLEYLDSLVAAPSPAVAVVPGPPEILASRLTEHKLLLVRRILRNARFVLAYSDTIASFYDGLIGEARSQVIPWPFDYDAARRVAGPPPRAAETIRIVLNVPLRFAGRAENYPFVLKAALVGALASLTAAERPRFSFHVFMYTDQDRDAFKVSGFADGLRVTVEPQRLFAAFVRFLASCDAVVNLTSSSVLGRITFLAAALDKPGLFTANSEINTRLYPGSVVPLLAPAPLRDALTELLRGLVTGDVPARFMPDATAARAAGDFSANAARFAGLFSGLAGRAEPQVTRPRIVYLQYGNPAAYPPLERSAAQLANAGWDVLFLGAHTAGVESLELAPQPRIRVVLRGASRGAWRLKLHYLWFCVWAAWRAVLSRPRWIYASDVMSAPVALLLKAVFGMRVVYHEHDAFDPAHATAFMRLCLTACRSLSRVSDLNVLPSDGRVEHFRRQNVVPQEKCARVWNCPSLAEVRPPGRDTAREHVRLLYHGSIVPARLPMAVLHAMTKVPGHVTLRLIGYDTIGSKGYVAQLEEEAHRLNLADRIEFCGTIGRHADLLALSDACDIGLALMPLQSDDVNVRSMAGASNKAFEYLARGLPMLVSDRPEWRAMFVDPGYARSCDPEDAESIADALRWYLRHPARAREMGENGRQRVVSEWNYERQFAPVFRVLTGRA